ncbi:MAG: hypothetical protein KDC61_01680, partial [Saprospiraceae bacterium]|nr:hypothetical protein [Saprospiraceae bacterium]
MSKKGILKLYLFSLTLLAALTARAQPFLTFTGGIQQVLPDEEKYHDFLVPESDSARQLILELKGADGGWIEYTYIDRFNEQRTQRVNAGEGATISTTYRIGTGIGEIPPGATIRMVIGKRGQWAKYDLLPDGKFGAGGGGGTAILMSRGQSSAWQILMVAGAGAGAGVQKMGDQIKYYPGQAGNSDEYSYGNSHPDKIAEGGTSGGGGKSVETSGGGGGAYGNGEHQLGELHYGNAGWKDRNLSGEPLGGIGGTQAGCRNGGWGFGGGGSG